MNRLFTCVVVLLALASSLSAQERWPRLTSVAFVDVERVMLEYRKTQEITASLDRKIEEESAKLRARKEAHDAKIAALREEEAVDTQDQAAVLARLQREEALALERVDIEIAMAVLQAQLEQKIAEHLRKVYAEVLAECEAIAQELGIQAIYMTRRVELGADQTKKGVMAGILIRPVLYRATELDLSSTLLDRLNRKP